MFILNDYQIAAALLLTPFFLSVLVFSIWRYFKHKNNSKPFDVSELERPPAFSLDQKLSEIIWDINEKFARLIILGGSSSILWLSDDKQVVKLVVFFALLLLACREIYKLLKLIGLKIKYQDGADAERAVGQTLNLLMSKGCAVFHDIPCGKFNIDHVVISSIGVFAVETKSRRKPKIENGHKVQFDGKTLFFPTWNDKTSIEQAKKNASWLSGELTSSTGEEVKVGSVLALPGWFIELKQRSRDVSVMNHKQLTQLKNYPTVQSLNDSRMRAICHQLRNLQKNAGLSNTFF